MPSLDLKAHAKLNLTLEVLGRRGDGYHEIASIMQTIDLCDDVRLSPADEIVLTCDDPALQSPDNLAFKAAQRLREVSGYQGGARIDIRKSIPVAAGLGGGSSDAAAALRGLNELWGLGMTPARLHAVAAEIGSDVPFLLDGGAAIALGRGERVRRLPTPNLPWITLLMPDAPHKRDGVGANADGGANVGSANGGGNGNNDADADAQPSKTAALYAMLNRGHYTKGMLTRKLEARVRGGGDVPPQLLFNAFDAVAFDAYPELRRYWDAFAALGAKEIHLSGSGPAMYAIASKREVASAMQLLLRHKHGYDARVVSAVDPQRL